MLDDNNARPAACTGIAPNIDEAEIRELFDCPAPAAGASPLSECDFETLQLASPVQQVGPGAPPALFYHGALDCQIPSAQSEELDDRYASAGVDSILRSDGIFVSAANDDQMLSSLAPNLICLLYTSPSPRDQRGSRMPSSA